MSQIGPDSDAPGRCPFCGNRFARHYSPLLVETVQNAEVAVGNFVHLLTQLRSLETGFKVDMDGLLEDVCSQIQESEPQRSPL